MKYRLTTTLNLLKQHGACEDGYRKLLKSLPAKFGHDTPINLLHILKSNGPSPQDMLWCLCCTLEDNLKPRCYMAADIAESTLHHFTAKYPNDDRPANAIKAARAVGDAAGAAGAAGAAARAAWAAGEARAVGSAGAAAWAAKGVTGDAEGAAETKKQAEIICKWLK